MLASCSLLQWRVHERVHERDMKRCELALTGWCFGKNWNKCTRGVSGFERRSGLDWSSNQRFITKITKNTVVGHQIYEIDDQKGQSSRWICFERKTLGIQTYLKLYKRNPYRRYTFLNWKQRRSDIKPRMNLKWIVLPRFNNRFKDLMAVGMRDWWKTAQDGYELAYYTSV